MNENRRNAVGVLFFLLSILALLLTILLRPSCVAGGGGSGPAVLPNVSGVPIPVPLYFETNDLLQTTADNANIIEIFGNNANAPAPFTQRLSGLLTTVDSANRVTIRNQRDITSYVVGDPTIYDTQFATIQAAIDQAIADGVDVSATPARQAQILVKSGDYPDDVLLPKHGISIVGLTDGRDRIVRIQGILTIQPLDSSAKTLINIKNLNFEGGVSGTPSIRLASTPLFNPKVLLQNISVRDGRQIVCDAVVNPVELSITDSLVEDIVCNGNSTIQLDNTVAQGNSITVSNDAGELGSILLKNGSQATIQTDPLRNSNFNVSSDYSTVTVQQAHLTPSTMASFASSFAASYSRISLTCGILLANVGSTAVSCKHCTGSVDIGSATEPFPQGVLEFEHCIFDNFTLRCNAPLPTDGTKLYFSKCSWSPNAPGRNRLAIEDYSTVAHGVFPFPVTVETNQCHFLSPIAISGLNTQITDVQSYHDLTTVQPPFAAPLGIYELNNGARLVPYNCTYKFRDLADFIVRESAGLVGVTWVRSTNTLGGAGGPQPNNYILNAGATSGNYQTGTVAFVTEGDAVV